MVASKVLIVSETNLTKQGNEDEQLFEELIAAKNEIWDKTLTSIGSNKLDTISTSEQP